jgi:prolyl-tRNA editing enzyme YbaK/EbsC (Cys-tRNA(Pro) deacylase)
VAIVDDRGHALAIILKSRRIDLQAVNAEFDRSFVLTSRDEIQRLFPERPPRAIPPIGNTEDIETFLDQELVTLDEVYFETEDPRRVVRVDGDAFRQLFYGSWCGRISQGVDQPRETPRDSPGKAA